MADSNESCGVEQTTKDIPHQSLVPLEAHNSTKYEVLGSDEVFEMLCEICNRDGVVVTAAAFCTSCVAYLCDTCLKYHGKFLPDHKYLTKDDIPQDVCTEKCKDHKNELLKFYCVSCEKFACSVCKMNEHKVNCLLEYLPDLVKDDRNGKELTKLVSIGESVITNLEKSKEMVKEKQEEISNITKEVKDVIMIEKDLVFAKFDQETVIMEEGIHAAGKTEQQRVDTLFEKYGPLNSGIEQLSLKVTQLPESPKSGEYKLFIELKEKQQLFKDLENSVNDLNKDSTRKNDSLKNELQLQAEVLKQRVKTFGNRTRKCNHTQKIASFIEDINLRNLDDVKDCDIFDCCILSKQYMIVSDINNSAVKLVDKEQRKVLYTKPTHTPPHAITKISDKEIAFVQRSSKGKDQRVIQFLSLTTSKQLIFKRRKIHTKVHCVDIAYIHDGRLIILMNSYVNGKVQILDMSGKILADIETDKEGNRYFISLQCITLNPVGNRAYISDWVKKSITEIDLVNETVQELAPLFLHPTAITMDKDGYIYVIEHGTSQVQVFHPHKSWTQVLLVEGSESLCPKSICYCEEGNKLYIGQYGENVLKVYSLTDTDVFQAVE